MNARRRAFTLVELLVVLSAALMLAALLFSALGHAREKSRQGVCASNLHQWGQAFSLYIQDYDGVDPQLGVPMTHAQLGLPPGSDISGFMKEYRIDHTAVESCPSAHYSSAQGAHTPRRISYILPGFLDDRAVPSYPQIVARTGEDLTLVTCEMHNVDTEFTQQPSWATKWVQSVHIDQRVRFHEVKASTSSTDE
jgi:prepilin-type N-terminal cleavage/methylation domain-containing protein